MLLNLLSIVKESRVSNMGRYERWKLKRLRKRIERYTKFREQFNVWIKRDKQEFYAIMNSLSDEEKLQYAQESGFTDISR